MMPATTEMCASPMAGGERGEEGESVRELKWKASKLK